MANPFVLIINSSVQSAVKPDEMDDVKKENTVPAEENTPGKNRPPVMNPRSNSKRSESVKSVKGKRTTDVGKRKVYSVNKNINDKEKITGSVIATPVAAKTPSRHTAYPPAPVSSVAQANQYQEGDGNDNGLLDIESQCIGGGEKHDRVLQKTTQMGTGTDDEEVRALLHRLRELSGGVHGVGLGLGLDTPTREILSRLTQSPHIPPSTSSSNVSTFSPPRQHLSPLPALSTRRESMSLNSNINRRESGANNYRHSLSGYNQMMQTNRSRTSTSSSTNTNIDSASISAATATVATGSNGEHVECMQVQKEDDTELNMLHSQFHSLEQVQAHEQGGKEIEIYNERRCSGIRSPSKNRLARLSNLSFRGSIGGGVTTGRLSVQQQRYNRTSIGEYVKAAAASSTGRVSMDGSQEYHIEDIKRERLSLLSCVDVDRSGGYGETGAEGAVSPLPVKPASSVDAAPVCNFLEFCCVGVDRGILNGTLAPTDSSYQAPHLLDIYPRVPSGLPLVDGIENYCFPHGTTMKLINRKEANRLIKCPVQEDSHILQFRDVAGRPTYAAVITVWEVVPLASTCSHLGTLLCMRKRERAANIIKRVCMKAVRARYKAQAVSEDEEYAQALAQAQAHVQRQSQSRSQSTQKQEQQQQPSIIQRLWGKQGYGAADLTSDLAAGVGIDGGDGVGIDGGDESGAGTAATPLVKEKCSSVGTSVRFSTPVPTGLYEFFSDDEDEDDDDNGGESSGSDSDSGSDSSGFDVVEVSSSSSKIGSMSALGVDDAEEVGDDVWFVASRRAYCLLSDQPCHNLLFRALNVIASKERNILSNIGSSGDIPTQVQQQKCHRDAFLLAVQTATPRLRHSFCTVRIDHSVYVPPFTVHIPLSVPVIMPLKIASSTGAGNLYGMGASGSGSGSGCTVPKLESAFADWTVACTACILPVQALLQLHSLLLMEKSLVVVARHSAVATVVSSALLRLLTPMRWEGVFVPHITSISEEILEAPVPFVVGTTRPPRVSEVSPSAAVLYVDDYASTSASMTGIIRRVGGSESTASSTKPRWLTLPEGGNDTHDDVCADLTAFAHGRNGELTAMHIDMLTAHLRSLLCARLHGSSDKPPKALSQKQKHNQKHESLSSRPTSMEEAVMLVNLATLGLTSEEALLSSKIQSLFCRLTASYLGDLPIGMGIITSTTAAASGVDLQVGYDEEFWNRYGSVNPLNDQYEFNTQWFLEPFRQRLRFQEQLANTQLFISYVEDLRASHSQAEIEGEGMWRESGL